MLYKIKFISDEVEGFLREIKIDSEATFLDLNKAILDACGYPDDQMTSFYVCDDEWERGQQITREDVAEPGHEDEDLYTMQATPLTDFIEDEGQKLEFVFDPFSERVFYLDVKELLPGEHLAAAEIVRSRGNAPVQIKDLDLSVGSVGAGKGDTFFSEDEVGEFYGDGAFDSEDFDPEGFEISDGQPY